MSRPLSASVAALVPLLLCSLLVQHWQLESEDFRSSEAFASDAEEALELLQRRGGYVASLAAKAEPKARGVETKIPNASLNVSQAPNASSGLQRQTTTNASAEALTMEDHVRAAVAAYALLPSAAAVGLPLLLTGCGVIEVAAAAAFWLLVRPAASALQACWWFLDLGTEARLREGLSLGFTPEALSILAHFYWAWGLGELVVRRRSVFQRLAAVLGLGVLLLPVPFAEVFLGRLSPHQVVTCALMGDVLGILFFFSLRLAPCWQLIQALPAHGRAGKASKEWSDEVLAPFHVYDNLSGFWGGCCWPQQRLRSKGGAFEGPGLEEAPLKGKDSAEECEPKPDSAGDPMEQQPPPYEEDFLLVRSIGAESQACGHPEPALAG